MAAVFESVDEESQRLTTFLDEVEKRVESFRRQATYILQEKASLITVLEQLKEESLNFALGDGDRQQFLANAERLKLRCQSVDVTVSTVRNNCQQKALNKINSILEDLRQNMDEDHATYKKQLEVYYNACLSESCGAVDSRFQSLVIECTVDDQKELRQRLDKWRQKVDKINSRS